MRGCGGGQSFLFRKDIRNPLSWKSHSLRKFPCPSNLITFFISYLPYPNLKIIPTLTLRYACLSDMLKVESVSRSIVSDSLQPHRLQPATRLICPWNIPGKNSAVGCRFLLQGIFLTQRQNPGLLHCRQILYCVSHQIEYSPVANIVKSLSHVRLFETLWTVAYQASPSMGFSRQKYWSGLPFPSPGYLPDPGIEPRSPTLEADAITSEPPKANTYKI